MRAATVDRQAGAMDTTSDIRRLVLGLTIGSFAIAALLGVIALLSGGQFGETQGRVLMTTLTVGVASIAILCALATAETPYVKLGVVAGIVVLWPTVQSLMLVWGYEPSWDDATFFKIYGLGLVIAGTLAQACLLLGNGGHITRIRPLMNATLAVAAALAVIGCVEIILEDGSWWRVMGVLGILDALGTVVTVAMGAFGRRDPNHPAVADQLVVPADLSALVRARAEVTGQTPEQVLRTALTTADHPA
jgi:hypothetical protein